MRLLHSASLELHNFNDNEIPPYAILSHCWGRDEISYQDMQMYQLETSSPCGESSIRRKLGFQKIESSAKLAFEQGFDYIWIDNCCIDKTSSAELSESINSMYRWYQESIVCFAFLADVQGLEDKSDLVRRSSAFHNSRWFRRGWTLQELVAPSRVDFYTGEWTFIGSKRDDDMLPLLSDITGIEEGVLKGRLLPEDVSIAGRMGWAANRCTTKTEDIAYCLMGIFDVNMPLLYGEGKKAFIRLQEEILKGSDDQSIFAWAAPQSEHATSEDVSGLLSSSPAWFKEVPSYRLLPPLPTGGSMPWNVTNLGLCVQLFLRPRRNNSGRVLLDEFEAIMACSTGIEHQDYSPRIWLRRLWGDQFARVSPESCDLIRFNLQDQDQTEGSYTTIFVKAKPTLFLPEFKVAPENTQATSTDAERFVLVDVEPKSMWDDLTGILKLSQPVLGRPAAVFRFQNTIFQDKLLDVAIGVKRSHAHDRWRPWVKQLPAKSKRPLADFLSDPEFIQLAGTLFHTPNIESTSDVARFPQQDEDTSMPFTIAKVEEIYQRSRKYFSLRVIIKPEIFVYTKYMPKGDVMEVG
ncbi:hypothetical protein PFICI_10423 [Pestalotiopsis fici W106-1]|uniref:Uncharacterized protein n=1 Tax=Pestalotiopsis fici (strain W106-1 / CGMCC3.15140) TaxID=1229662 RepID=W3WZP6_PESFW|nr:uncharacterized protein PFICI_10423 [Pestalotiopsis fici W106-1]ETS78361.1 hypothetical protein PFICI_10423 [Pestalotiopsis fici W106-1]